MFNTRVKDLKALMPAKTEFIYITKDGKILNNDDANYMQDIRERIIDRVDAIGENKVKLIVL